MFRAAVCVRQGINMGLYVECCFKNTSRNMLWLLLAWSAQYVVVAFIELYSILSSYISKHLYM